MLRSATTHTLPPRPPSPPSGPPLGMNFSRRNEAQPLPPSPATTSIVASSMNFMLIPIAHRKQKGPAANGRAFVCDARGQRALGRHRFGLHANNTATLRPANTELHGSL